MNVLRLFRWIWPKRKLPKEGVVIVEPIPAERGDLGKCEQISLAREAVEMGSEKYRSTLSDPAKEWYERYRANESKQVQPLRIPEGRGYASGRGAEDMDLSNTIFAVGAAVALSSDTTDSGSSSDSSCCD
ncbi:hypothetical protein [Pseudomonas phage PA1C]|nr:hypothetical protein [Pseudomonas phage PA1C]